MNDAPDAEFFRQLSRGGIGLLHGDYDIQGGIVSPEITEQGGQGFRANPPAAELYFQGIANLNIPVLGRVEPHQAGKLTMLFFKDAVKNDTDS